MELGDSVSYSVHEAILHSIFISVWYSPRDSVQISANRSLWNSIGGSVRNIKQLK